MAISAISGMGGIGKTELAWQYADRQGRAGTYPGGICWLRAREEVGTQILGFARSCLDLDPPMEGDLESRVRWCWQRWRSGDALIVLDDVQTLDEIRSLLPLRESRFKVLMTSRLRFGDPVKTYEIPVLDEASSLKLLGAIVSVDAIDAELETAKQVCEWLGYLPLALELVGRYWKKNRNWSLAKVFEKLKEKELKARAFVRSQEMTATHEALVAAFDLSWQELHGNAQRLGAYLSVLALAPIPWGMVEAALSEWDEEDLQEARSTLVDFSLITDLENEWYELHTLIRLFFASKLPGSEGAEEWKQALCRVAVRVCQQIEPTTTIQHVQKFAPIMPHLEMVAQQLAQAYCEDEDLGWAFTGVARFYDGQGLYQQAEKWHEQCLQVTSDRFGDNHPDVAISLNNLANLYRLQGRYGEAEPLHLQSLEIQRQQSESDHPNVAKNLNNLALLYQLQGRYGEAEPLFLQALEIQRQQLGEDHPDIAMSLNNLALLYRSQGRYREAEPLYLQALEIQRRQLGEDHPQIAMCLNNLAVLYQFQGRCKEAEPLYIQSLEIRQRQLGEDHPDVATTLNNLAMLYQVQEQYEKAELLCIQALTIKQLRLGDNHPEIATSLNNLATLYRSQGRYEKAEVLHLQALEINKSHLGEDHPNVALALNDIAFLYQSQKRYEEAEPLYIKALELSNRLLGVAHPETMNIRQNYTDCRKAMLSAFDSGSSAPSIR